MICKETRNDEKLPPIRSGMVTGPMDYYPAYTLIDNILYYQRLFGVSQVFGIHSTFVGHASSQGGYAGAFHTYRFLASN